MVFFGTLPEGSATLRVKANDTEPRQFHHNCNELNTFFSIHQTSMTAEELGSDRSVGSLEHETLPSGGISSGQSADTFEPDCTATVSPVCVAITNDNPTVEVTVSPVCNISHHRDNQEIRFTVSAPERLPWIALDPVLGLCVPSIDAPSSVCDETTFLVNGSSLESGNLYSTEIVVDFQNADNGNGSIFKYTTTLTVFKVIVYVLNPTKLQDGILSIPVAVKIPPGVIPTSEIPEVWAPYVDFQCFPIFSCLSTTKVLFGVKTARYSFASEQFSKSGT